jgi:hypothetical protein
VWKITVKGTSKVCPAGHREQDLVLAPGAFWERFLHPNLEKLLQKKLSSNETYKSDGTNVTVSVNDRGERNLIKIGCSTPYHLVWTQIGGTVHGQTAEMLRCRKLPEAEQG